jgi:MFS family permease
MASSGPIPYYEIKSNSPLVQTWVSILIAVYGGALAVASPLCGYAADRISNRRLPLLLGLIALAGATVLLQLGSSIGILVLGRVLQGISAAVVWVVGLALLVDTVPQAELGQAMGLVFLAMSLGVLVGPLFGGFLFEKAGYNAVYAMAYGFIGFDIVLRLLMIENKPTARSEIDQTTEIVLDDTSSIETELEKMGPKTKDIEAGKEIIVQVNSSSSFPIPGSDSDSTQAPKKKRPAILVLLRSRRLLSCLWGVMAVATLGSQFDSVLPIHVSETFAWTSTAAGLAFLPITLTAFLSPIVGWGVDKIGPRWFAASGFAGLAIFEGVMGLVVKNSLSQKVLLCVLLGMIGICFDLIITPLMVEITAVVEAKEKQEPGIFGPKGAMAQAYGLFNTAWAVGSLVGPIWAGFVNERLGWQIMTTSLAVLSIVSIIPATIWTGGSILHIMPRGKKNRKADVEAVGH